MDLKFLFLNFDGRINRAKFWLGGLILFAIELVGLVLDVVTGVGVFFILAALAVIVPSLAVNIKRCHDRGRSGWFVLLCLVPIISIWYLVEIGFLRGTVGPNAYGADPLPAPMGAAASA